MSPIKNKVQLIGIVQKPEITTWSGGVKKVKVLLSTNELFVNARGERVKETMWHTCYLFGKLAELVDRYVVEGTELAVEGSLIQTSVSTNSERVDETSVHVKEVLILTKKSITN